MSPPPLGITIRFTDTCWHVAFALRDQDYHPFGWLQASCRAERHLHALQMHVTLVFPGMAAIALTVSWLLHQLHAAIVLAMHSLSKSLPIHLPK